MQVIGKQTKLPLGKAVEIAIKSLRVRLARSILTLITIVMAIAFLTNVWASRVVEPPIRRAYFVSQGLNDVGEQSSTEKLVWLITLSLLVCTVGIANAMLMSVMERFREIGTMKCLGALDSFILKLFFIESLFLGLLGTLLGTTIGLTLTVLLQVHMYGGIAWGHMPWQSALLIGVGSCGVGMLITAAAAMYPALKAARMEPIAAMRVEV